MQDEPSTPATETLTQDTSKRKNKTHKGNQATTTKEPTKREHLLQRHKQSLIIRKAANTTLK